jgi:hypothetical protein
MADELGPDKVRDLWCNQPVEPVRISADDMRRKAQLKDTKFRRGLCGMAVLMFFAAAGWTSFLYFFPSPVHRIGITLTLIAYLYCAYRGFHLYRSSPFRKVPVALASATSAAYRAILEHQRDLLCTTFWGTFMAPFIPGPAVFMMGFIIPEHGIVIAISLATAIILPPNVLAIMLCRQKARTLQREIDELDALMR